MDILRLSLIQMSFSGAVFILVIILLRAVAINRLPKKMFLVLWGIALLRLIVPFSVPSAVSVYSLFGQNADADPIGQTPIRNLIPVITEEQEESDDLVRVTELAKPMQSEQNEISQSQQAEQSQVQQLQQAEQSPMQQQLQVQTSQPSQLLQQISLSQSGQSQVQQTTGPLPQVSVWFLVWCVGMILCAVFFVVSYMKWYFRFCTSIPVDNSYVEQWLKEHRLRRRISIRQSDRTAAPLTYGILRPVILLPKKTDWENTEQMQYVLLHEYVHIRRFDTVTKFTTVTALCVHWFNPFVWVMYILFNRDLELSCDESVVQLLGMASKSDYARVLINMEAKKDGLMPLYNNFSRNAIEERIKSIMKIKKTSLAAIIAAVIVVIVITAVFITSARSSQGEDGEDLRTDAGADRLTVNPQLLQYMDMTYGQFKEQTGRVAKFYHANYFSASVPDIEVDIVFEGTYDRELIGPALADDDKSFRIEGNLSTIINGVTEKMYCAEFAAALEGAYDILAVNVNEGAGTAYYVADNYIDISVDIDGDHVEDAWLQAALDETGSVSPDSYTWLVRLDARTRPVIVNSQYAEDRSEGYDVNSAALPNYYHYESDADETAVYLGGVGGIYKVGRTTSEVVYSNLNVPGSSVLGVALYKDYIYSIEDIYLNDAVTVNLIRMHKDGSGREVLTQLHPGCYDLRITDNMLVIESQILGEYTPEKVYTAYTLDEEGSLVSDVPADAYSEFELPDDVDRAKGFLIDPWFSTKYYGYRCYAKPEGDDLSSIWIERENGEPAKKVAVCSGNPILTNDMIYYYDRNRAIIMQCSLNDEQETGICDVTPGDRLTLFTYDDEWLYFLQEPELNETIATPTFVVRLNLKHPGSEIVYQLEPVESVYYFSVYGDRCYFVFTDKPNGARWMSCDLSHIPHSQNEGYGQSDGDLEATATLTIMKEGMVEGKTATLYTGDGYSLYIMDYVWVPFLSDAWYLYGALDMENPEYQVYMFVGNYEGMNVSQAENMLKDRGYTMGEKELWKLENGIMSRIRCYETAGGVRTFQYTYPQETEEGWGADLKAMADTFTVTDN